jgi:hypothetical protein
LTPLTLRATLADISLTLRHIGCDSPVECSYYLSAIAVHARSESKAATTSMKSSQATTTLNNKLPLSTDPRDITISWPSISWPWTDWPFSYEAVPTTTLYARHGLASTSTSKPDVKPTLMPQYAEERTGVPTCNFHELECSNCNKYPSLCLVSFASVVYKHPDADRSSQRCGWSSDTFDSQFQQMEECKTYSDDGIFYFCKQTRHEPYHLPDSNSTEHSHGPVVVPHHSNDKKVGNDNAN